MIKLLLRVGFQTLLYTIGPFCVLFLSAAFGVAVKSWIVFFVLFALGLFAIYKLGKFIYKVGRKDMSGWLSSVGDCDYKYAWDGTGIAVNLKEKKIYLAASIQGKTQTKEYPCSSIREWQYYMLGSPVRSSPKLQIVGDASTLTHGFVLTDNIMSGVRDQIFNTSSKLTTNELNGFLVTTADVDFPKWFIKFQASPGLQLNLDKWMEISNQTVNA